MSNIPEYSNSDLPDSIVAPTASDVTERAAACDGYARLSEVISQDFRHTGAIFPRFDHLAIRNLMYMASELVELEAKFAAFDEKDVNENMKCYLQDWPLLVRVAEAQSRNPQGIADQEEALERKKLGLELREKIEAYHRTMKTTFEIFSLPHPEKDDIAGNKAIMLNSLTGEEDAGAILSGNMLKHLDNVQDLCALTTQGRRDMFTKLIEKNSRLREFFTPGEVSFDMKGYERLTQLVTIFSILLVVIWVVAAIVGLYFWKSDHGRLILLSLLTLLFATTVSLVTNAHRQEIYSATAAYAAVLVVFIGSTLQDNRNVSAAGSSNNNSNITPRALACDHKTPPTEPTLPIDGSFGREVLPTYFLHGMAATAIVFSCAFGLSAMRRKGFKWRILFL